MLVQLLIVLLIVGISFYLLARYVAPVLPAPWGNIVLGVIAVIIVIALLNQYVGLGL